MASKELIEQALNDVRARMLEIAPAHEGLRDYLELNVQESTRAELQASLDEYDSMLTLMEKFETVADELLSAGYPNLEPRPVSVETLTDLQTQIDTITAARAQFREIEAETGTMNFSPPLEGEQTDGSNKV